MPDELIELAAAATVDAVVREAAKILNILGSILFIAFMAGVVYVTVRYS